MRPLFVNGKFCLQRMTGVQRVAAEVVMALDRQLAAEPVAGLPRPVLLLPPGARPPALDVIEPRVVAGPASATAWEQLALPRAARAGVLLNLAGSAPALGVAGQVSVMHDAAVFDQPQAYTWAFRHWYRALFRRQARHAAGLMTVSGFSRARLAACLAQPERRWALLTPGAEHLLRTPADPGWLRGLALGERPLLVAVGSANPTKNHRRLLRAWQRLGRGHEASLVLVGGASGRVFAAGDMPEVAGVVHAGNADDAALRALFERAHGLVFPSLYEGFGLPPLEAMACGCPVAVAQAASLPEVCGDAALGFDPLDEHAIATAMARLLDEADLRATLRARGRAHAAGFTWARAAGQVWQALMPGLRAEGSVA